MDAKFHPAIAALQTGDVEWLRSLLRENPWLATARSAISHPTLLQCLVLDVGDAPNGPAMAHALIDAGAAIDAPLVAAASMNRTALAGLLLDAGAALDGDGVWSPLEEALYWGHRETADLLLARGASIHNLRIAAGAGRIDALDSFFAPDGNLKPEAGWIAGPFEPNRAGDAEWTHDRQNIIDNAFVYACINDRVEAVERLLQIGARIDSIPPGFDFAGTGLHNAALQGHRRMVEFLVARGANVNILDTKVGQTAAGWAAYGGHEDLKNDLERVGRER